MRRNHRAITMAYLGATAAVAALGVAVTVTGLALLVFGSPQW
jgi:hypothetical protein